MMVMNRLRHTEIKGTWQIVGVVALSILGVLALLNGIFATISEAPVKVGQGISVGASNPVAAPAVGIEGYDVFPFCEDSKTKVRQFPVPDSTAITYQLTRLKDTKTESIIVTGEPGVRVATHYWDETFGQQSEPAYVTADAMECIRKKVGA